jgi:FkbM family methyltransferase
MFGAVSRFFRRAGRSFGRERIYRSSADALKSVVLRISAEKPDWPLIPARKRPWRLRLRGMDQPVYVRPSSSDYYVLRDLFEDEEYGSVARFDLPSDATILDLGGNIGLSVRYFLTRYPKSRIAAVEPDEGNLEMLRMNCREAIAAGRVIPIRGFAAAEDGQAEIDRSDLAWGFKKRDSSVGGRSELIPCLGVPSLLREAGFDRIDLLKVDIEGAERELFEDCRGWVGRVEHMAVETHPPYGVDDLYAALRNNGWDFEVLHEIRYTPAPRIFLRRIKELNSSL